MPHRSFLTASFLLLIALSAHPGLGDIFGQATLMRAPSSATQAAPANSSWRYYQPARSSALSQPRQVETGRVFGFSTRQDPLFDHETRPAYDRQFLEIGNYDRPRYDRPDNAAPRYEIDPIQKPALQKPLYAMPNDNKPNNAIDAYYKPDIERPSTSRPVPRGPNYDVPTDYAPAEDKPSYDRPYYDRPEYTAPTYEPEEYRPERYLPPPYIDMPK